MQSFSHTINNVAMDISLNNAVESCLIIMEYDFKKAQINIEKKFTLDLSLVKISPELLNQIILNMFANAVWAIRKKSSLPDYQGKITLSTRQNNENKTVQLIINDNGIGIPPTNINRIFEPFFTTKDVNEGRGLSLYVAYTMIKEFGGEISVESKENQGTTFTLNLPIP
jgi:two-component system NtrC family sensor kinase